MTASLATAFDSGLRAHRSGRIETAIASYTAVLDSLPDHPAARHLRGFALLQLGRAAKAVGDLEIAVRLNPGNADAWGHLAASIDLARGADAAVAVARRAAILTPNARDPLDILARGTASDVTQARRLIATAPGDPGAWTRLALAEADARPHRAREFLRRAVSLHPADPSSLLDLCDVARRCGEPGQSLVLARRALALRPHDPRAWAEKAAAATELDAVAEALADTRHAVLVAPGHAVAWSNRGEAHYRLADYPSAVADGMRARIITPADPRVLANLGAYRLAVGDLAAGWPLFRHRPARRTLHLTHRPRWSGEQGARLLVLAEQGLGDELLFSTLWGDLRAKLRSGELRAVTVEVDRRLTPLARRAQPEIEWRERFSGDPVPDDITHWCLAGDLAEILRSGAADFPGAGLGLRADANRVAQWRRWVSTASAGRPVIGFCWRSGLRGGHRQRHYPAIGACAELLGLANHLFVALQYDECADEISRAPVGANSALILPPELDRRDDQDGVAALMLALDGVVSADTAVLALAGAVGVPAIGFCLHPGWVGLGQNTHPWFPGVQRIYRAPSEPWNAVFSAVVQAMGRFTQPQ